MDRSLALVVAAVAAVLVGGFVTLALAGRDTIAYALFLGGPAVSAVIGALVVQRTAKVQADVALVKKATNGIMKAHFGALGVRLDEASAERKDIAAAVAAQHVEIETLP